MAMRAVILALVLSWLPAARAGETRVHVGAIPDAATFETYSRVSGGDRFGKFLIDHKTTPNLLLRRQPLPAALGLRLPQFYKREMTNEDIPEYNLNYEANKPRFIMGYLTHHQKTNIWTYSFWEGDEITAKDIRSVCARLHKTFYVQDISWRPDSPLQEKRLAELTDLRTITNDKIYKLSPYQSFNNGRAVGRLRIVPPGTKVEDLIFERDEIAVLQESYPDITPVAGIVQAVFCTPLSHVSLRAREWGIPNAGLKDVATRYAALGGKWVVLEVRDADLELRAATDAEIKEQKDKVTAARTVFVPRADLSVRDLRPLDKMRAKDRVAFGTKAANLGEIVSARIGIPVPDGFGVPLSMYADHMKRNKLDKLVVAMLADKRWQTDAVWRKATLETLRDKIHKAPINPATLEAVWNKVQKDFGGAGVFVRSSTNAEDLEGFNGAGLYDTVPNVMSREDMADALRQVWGSIWNYHAVEERSLFNIDHRACFAGVLVQVALKADAAGVLITKNIYDAEDDRSYTINAKRGLGLRVVGGTTVPEQIIYDTGNFGTKIISRSDDPTMLVTDEHGGVREVPNDNKGVILTEARARALSETVRRFVPLFSSKYPLDVEWVIVGDKVWIVQARPYVSK
jgi:phosphoenolpyruvate synthase/pyruvate phosphate dikinase